MAGKTIYSPSILIDSVEYKCIARSVSLIAGGFINYCEQEWTFSADIELDYTATTGSWHLLNANADTVVDVVLKPEDATVGSGNPSATFQIRQPAPDFMNSSGRGERQVWKLSIVTEAEPATAIA